MTADRGRDAGAGADRDRDAGASADRDRDRADRDAGADRADDGAPTALVITVSTRASRGEYSDRTGPVLVAALRELGFATPDALVVPDLADLGEESLGAALRRGIAAATDVILTTGGTGITVDDVTADITAEVARSLGGRDVPGIPEALRAAGVANGVPTAVLSRGLAVIVQRTLVVNLPGSQGAVEDAIAVLAPVLPHAVAELRRPGPDRMVGT